MLTEYTERQPALQANECMIQDADGSRNTEYGVGLYIAIEQAVIDHIEMLKGEKIEIIQGKNILQCLFRYAH